MADKIALEAKDKMLEFIQAWEHKKVPSDLSMFKRMLITEAEALVKEIEQLVKDDKNLDKRLKHE